MSRYFIREGANIREYCSAIKPICTIITILDHFCIICLMVSLAALVIFRALSEYQPNIYISMDHDWLILIMNLGTLMLVACVLCVQVTWCQHICRAGTFLNYYKELRKMSPQNATVNPDLGDGQELHYTYNKNNDKKVLIIWFAKLISHA